MPELDRTAQGILDAVHGWLNAREQIVAARARTKTEEAPLFANQPGTHLAFLQALNTHSMMMAGALPQMNPAEIEACRELVSAWASNIELAHRGGKP